MMHRGAYDEGKAARSMGSPRTANPYYAHRDKSSLYGELSSDWQSGWLALDLERAIRDAAASHAVRPRITII